MGTLDCFLGWGTCWVKGHVHFWGFWQPLPNRLQEGGAHWSLLQQSREPPGARPFTSPWWCCLGYSRRQQFLPSLLSLCFSFLPPFVSFLGFLPNSLLWKDRLINPVLINNLKLHSATVGVNSPGAGATAEPPPLPHNCTPCNFTSFPVTLAWSPGLSPWGRVIKLSHHVFSVERGRWMTLLMGGPWDNRVESYHFLTLFEK